jgi:hypothetical protein
LGFLPYQNPPWQPTWDLAQSTIAMAIDPDSPYNQTLAAGFGILSFDWSTEKALWVNSRPMDCEEKMLEEAKITKTNNPDSHVFVYRNLVKALPWFSSVRKILDDPAYAGFFLRFNNPNGYHVPDCTTQNGQTKCSNFYHDQEQTPQVPNATDPNPDGACDTYCDCGSVPCGEYLFDHRNGTMLTDWLLNEYILSETSVGSPYVDGLFIDDFWCSNIINGSQQCTDPVQGPSEINQYSQIDMGLSDQDIADITKGWLSNMELVQEAILKNNAYTWSLIPGQANANAQPLIVDQKSCLQWMNQTCNPSNPFIDAPLLAGITYQNGTPFIEQELASFLLMRGPYAYIGFGEWGMVWPTNVNLPSLVWGSDFGTPIDDYCQNIGESQFQRRFTKSTVTLNCQTWEATFQIL